jgi:RNA polymerase sigma-70 factor (ECF subfamily)
MEPIRAHERGTGMHSTPTSAAVSGARIGSAAASAGLDAEREPLVISLKDGAVIEGVDRSFEDFYRRSRGNIARALSIAFGDVDLGTEATDEAMARAYERWASVRHLDRPEAWVYRVAMNWARSVLRRRRRSPHRLYNPGSDTAAVRDPDVHAALAQLDVKHRTVIVCRHLLGWSVAETAAALGLREGTVKSRLHRAHRTLHSRLQHLRPEEQQ